MKVLVYQNIIDIIKANVINTINVAKGFIQNDCNVYFFVSNNDHIDFINNNINNINFVIHKTHNEVLQLINSEQIGIVYVRDRPFAEFLLNSSYDGHIISEDHDINLPSFIDKAKSNNKFILTTISPQIEEKYQVKNNVLFPCSIDFEYFSNTDKFKNDLFDKSKINVTYCGHLYDYKGIPFILKLAEKYLHINFHLVGGKEKDINRNKEKSSSNVFFWGHKDYHNIPNYLYSSDILLVPYDKHGNEWSPSFVTSPIKLFEYLSTKKPVLCSDIIGIKNWVSDKEVFFYKANNFNDMCKKFEYILNNLNSNETKTKLENGFKKAEEFSVYNKCKKILEKINEIAF